MGRAHGEQQQSGAQTGWPDPTHSRKQLSLGTRTFFYCHFLWFTATRVLPATAVLGQQEGLTAKTHTLRASHSVFHLTEILPPPHAWSVFPVKPLPQRLDPLVHHGHLHVALLRSSFCCCSFEFCSWLSWLRICGTEKTMLMICIH